MNRWLLLIFAFAINVGGTAVGDDSAIREWTDSTGRFKINARLVEVRDGVAFLENASGQTIKIPASRLSQADQRFLEVGANPFEVVGGSEPESMDAAEDSGARDGNWMTSRVDWSRVREVAPDFSRWRAPPANAVDGFVLRRASLPKKQNFHERPHPIVVNASIGRAVIGHTVSFAVDKPMTRIDLIDLQTGRSVHAAPIAANMKPIALLDDGNSMLMVGAARRSDDGETGDMVQRWKLRSGRLRATPSWIPYPDENKSFGRTANSAVVSAGAIDDDMFYTISENGHLAVWNSDVGRPAWHLRMSERHFDVALSPAREMMAIVDEKAVSLVESKTGFVLGGTRIPEAGSFNWPKIRWSPDGQSLYVGSSGRMHRIDALTGDWIEAYDVPTRSLNSAVEVPKVDFALFDKKTLVHLPTGIDVATYNGIDSLAVVGDDAIVVVQDQSGGLVMPVKFPTPKAAELLGSALSNPKSFLVHPGVAVSIDVSDVPAAYRDRVEANLSKAATAAGYEVRSGAPLQIIGQISEPYQDAINFQPHGSYIVTKIDSTVRLIHGLKMLVARSESNISPMIAVPPGGSFELTLERLGETPNIAVFGSVMFPRYIADGEAKPGSTAMMTGAFGLRGLVE